MLTFKERRTNGRLQQPQKRINKNAIQRKSLLAINKTSFVIKDQVEQIDISLLHRILVLLKIGLNMIHVDI